MAVTVVVAFAAALAGLAYQISAGEIRSDFLRDRLAAAIAARLPPQSQLRVGTTAIAFRSGQGLAVDATDVAVALPDGVEIRARSVSTLSELAELVSGRIDLNSVRVEGLTVVLPFPADGTIPADYADEARRIALAIARGVAEADDGLRSAGLDDVTISDAVLELASAPANVPERLAIRQASWMPLRSGRSKVWVDLGSGEESWTMQLEREHRQSGESRVELAVSDLPAGALSRSLAGPATAPAFPVPVDLRGSIALRADDSLAGLSATVSLGSGKVMLSPVDAVELVQASFDLALGPSGNLMLLRSGSIRTVGSWFNFAGGVSLGGGDKTIGLSGRLVSGFIDTGPRSDRVNLVGGTLAATLDLARRAISLDQVEVITDRGHASVVGQASLDGPAAGLSLAISASEMPPETVRALWPDFVAPKTHEWVDQHVIGGTVGPATISVALPIEFLGEGGKDKVLPPYGVVGRVPFRDAVFTPLDLFPPIVGGSGEIVLADATAAITAKGGRIPVPGRGDVDVAGTTLTIPSLGGPDPVGTVALKASGPASALAMLADTPPFDIPSRRGIDPARLTGSATLKLDAAVPLTAGKLGDVEPFFELALTGFASGQPIEGRSVEQGDLLLKGAGRSYRLMGDALVDGIRAALDLNLGEDDVASKGVTLTLDAAARKRLGIDLDGLVDGTVQAAVSRVDDRTQAIELDLSKARISLPFLGWEKGAGVPAKARFRLQEAGAQTRLSEIRLEGKGFGAAGDAVLADGRLTSLALAKVKLRPGDDFSLDAKASGSGYTASVRGESLDARALLQFGGGGNAESAPPRIALDLNFNRVIGKSGTVLEGVKGELAVVDGRFRSLSLQASTGGNGKVTASVVPDGKLRRTTLHATDGGALLRFAGIYERLSGGELTLDFAGPAGDGPGRGLLRLVRFSVLNEAALAEVLKQPAAGSRSRASVPASAQSGTMSFTELHVPFRSSEGALEIGEAYLRGPSLGGTGSGTVNLAGQRIAITGTLVPAFGLNNIAGALPFIGGILGGGRNEGLVGITYKLYGPLDAPTMTMNPISAMAPGILRKLFEY
ncbi:hypothetical protein ACUN0C_04540 [Faunimonas sp. B44]